jgi:hypothetical protein
MRQWTNHDELLKRKKPYGLLKYLEKSSDIKYLKVKKGQSILVA